MIMFGKRIDKLDDKKFTRGNHALKVQFKQAQKFMTKHDERLINSVQVVLGMELLEVGQMIRELRERIVKLEEKLNKEDKENVSVDA